MTILSVILALHGASGLSSKHEEQRKWTCLDNLERKKKLLPLGAWATVITAATEAAAYQENKRRGAPALH